MNWLKSALLIAATWLGSNMTWATLRPLIVEFLKSQFVRVILLKMFGSAISGGYKAFIAKLIVQYAFDELALPIIQLAFRKMGYVYHRTEGQIIFKRIEEAKVTDDEKKYDQAVDDLFRR